MSHFHWMIANKIHGNHTEKLNNNIMKIMKIMNKIKMNKDNNKKDKIEDSIKC